jgi:chemotaxis protein MotB
VSAARRHKKQHHEEHENHERWLVSGYDMMTLLFAVFVVLFALSSTNVSKIQALQQSLQEAFSGPVFSGGQAMQQTGTATDGTEKATPEPPLPSISPSQALLEKMEGSQTAAEKAEAAGREQAGFEALKRKLDEEVEKAGLAEKVSTVVTIKGLKIRLLTDKLFFDSGSAAVNTRALPTLAKIGGILGHERKHPISVEGHTDDRPIQSGQFPSNWELSGARAAAVLRRLQAAGVRSKRMTVTGNAAQKPIASNRTAEGRARNRRVEIVLTRLHGATTSQGGD